MSLRLAVLVIFARLRNCHLLCLACLSLILKIAACPTSVLLGDLEYFDSNSLLVWVADWKVIVKAEWRINMSGASGGRNQHFIKEWHLLLDCKVRRRRLAVRAACSAAWAVFPFPPAGQPVLESIPLSYQALGALLITYWGFVHRLHHPLPGVQGAWKVPSPALVKQRCGGME